MLKDLLEISVDYLGDLSLREDGDACNFAVKSFSLPVGWFENAHPEFIGISCRRKGVKFRARVLIRGSR